MDVEERKEREICEHGRELTEEERRITESQAFSADASAAQLRAQREAENRERELHREEFGHYPTKLPCLKCQADAARAKGEDAPPVIGAEAIECPQCKHVMLRTEVGDYRAHGQECVAYEIRTRRNEATLSELSKRLIELEKHAASAEEQQRLYGRVNAIVDRLEAAGGKELVWHVEELQTSLLAFARYLLEPGECMAPEDCGGSDLCPCRTDGHFAGTCGINETLVALLNEHIDRNPAPWRHHKANEKTYGTTEESDTQRSPRKCTSVIFGKCGYCAACTADDSVEPPTDASAAEPERPEAPGAERGGGESERAGGPDPGVPGTVERGDR